MIQNVPKRLFRRYLQKYLIPRIKFSYAQFGEDIIIAHFFTQLGIDKPSYLDIGANEPRHISNTYYFYEQGATGVLIEPNPYLFKKLQKVRPKDIVVNTGIGIEAIAEADFYLFPDTANGLSTFSKKEADHWQQVGMKGVGKIPLEKVIKMPLISVTTIFEKYFKGSSPDFISLDVEGFDFDILKSIDFTKYRPKIICVETLLYNEEQKGYKNKELIDFLVQNGYIVYADTHVNTIFCNKESL